MRLQLLHIEHHELVRREESLHRQQREVREVFVINGVELIACNQPHQMRKLYRDHPTGREQNPQSRNEVVELGYLGEHVIPDQQVGPLAAGSHLPRHLPPKELDPGRHALLDRHLGHIRSRLDPLHRDAPGHEPLQQVAVIARDLHHPTVPVQAEPLDHVIGVISDMIEPSIRIRREVGVIAEDRLSAHGVLPLGEWRSGTMLVPPVGVATCMPTAAPARCSRARSHEGAEPRPSTGRRPHREASRPLLWRPRNSAPSKRRGRRFSTAECWRMALAEPSLANAVQRSEEPSLMFSNVYAGRRVLVTGHTGFKGSWLCTWLLELGADIAGYSLDIPTNPSNFEILALSQRLRHYQGDVRDREQLGRVFDEFRPEIVFHLAAQSPVRRSYCDPVTTFETNAIGTMNVLECMRQRAGVGVGVIITSDKCYRNVDWTWGYRENDALGGADPYSGSKGCAELITYSYVRSFFSGRQGAAAIATARGGNVIGGGDWTEDGLVPDCVRAWSKGDAAVIRHPEATRPWQHVLDALSGYLWLGSQLWCRNPQVVGEAYK